MCDENQQVGIFDFYGWFNWRFKLDMVILWAKKVIGAISLDAKVVGNKQRNVTWDFLSKK